MARCTEPFCRSRPACTLVVCLRACSQKRNEWNTTYESIHECVVPRSSKELFQDDTGILFSVTLFKRPESAVKEFSGVRQLRHQLDALFFARFTSAGTTAPGRVVYITLLDVSC